MKNNLPITNFDDWVECSIQFASELNYHEYLYCNNNNKNIHGYVIINDNIRYTEGILLSWKENPFNLDDNSIRLDKIINICKIK